MAEAQFIEDVEELDDELPNLSQSAAWIVVDPQSLSAAQFALNSNLSAIADRQDAYYREVLKKFLDYPKTSGSDISADALPTPAPTKKGMKAPVNPGSDFEQQALANWDVLSNLLQEFEKSGQPLVLHYGKDSFHAAPKFWSFCTERVSVGAELENDDLRSTLASITDQEDQEEYFIKWCRSLKRGNGSKE